MMKTSKRMIFAAGMISFSALFLPSAVSGTEDGYFTYKLEMCDVDAIRDGRKLPGARPSAIGFGKEWTAEKKLPYKIGPGPVRVYIRVFPEQTEISYNVAVGNKSGSVSIPGKGYSHYHMAEIKLELTEAGDVVHFKSSHPDGRIGRSIWYETLLTNDPAWKYIPGKRGAEVCNRLRYETSRESLPDGNRIQNSGFEEGLKGWTISPYKCNTAVKPSMLFRGDAAHGNYSMNIGSKSVISDWSFFEPGQEAEFSFYTAASNKSPVKAVIEYQDAERKTKTLFSVNAGTGAGRSGEKWIRTAKKFTLPDGSGATGDFRVRLESPAGAGEKTLVDSVQVTDASTSGEYLPHEGLEGNLVPQRFQSIYFWNEPAEVPFNLYRRDGMEIKKCRISAYDYFDRKLWTREIPVETGAASCSIPVKLDTGRVGFFRVIAEIDYRVNGKEKQKKVQFAYNVVYPRSMLSGGEKSLFGSYFTAAPEEPLGYGESVGKFGFVEFNSLGHSLMRWKNNTTPGSRADNVRYVWTGADQEIKRFAERGINITCNFHLADGSYGAPSWAFVPDEKDPGKYYRVRGRRTPAMKVSRELWLDYVGAFAKRYQGKIGKYVIQDEPEYYFDTLEDYARFYLDTRKAIKSADPSARVFYNGFCHPWKLVQALASATGGKPEQFMDGVHAYLSSQHAGKNSAGAEPEFRNWLRKHNIPLVTATCFSSADRLDASIRDGAGFSCLARRSRELSTVHYFYDGLIWGGARCHYYYYGAMPGEDSGTYLFDSTGGIKPVFHFFSAANRLLGNFLSVKSIDSHKNFRIGIFDMGNNRGVIVLYSVDGRIYDFDIPGLEMKVDDALGCRLSENLCGPYPVLIETNDLAKAEKMLEKISFKEKIRFEWSFRTDKRGLVMKLELICDRDPEASSLADLPDRSGKYIVRAVRSGKDRYSLEIPLYQPPSVPYRREVQIPLSTRWGDLCPEFKLDYTPQEKVK